MICHHDYDYIIFNSTKCGLSKILRWENNAPLNTQVPHTYIHKYMNNVHASSMNHERCSVTFTGRNIIYKNTVHESHCKIYQNISPQYWM